jgi:hypothetical protein
MAGFAIAALITLLLAFNGGGYDPVIRHQVGLAVWALIVVGLGLGVLPRGRLTPACWVALGGFGALAGLTLISHAWTRSDEQTTEELARILEYGGVILLAFVALNRYTWRGAALGFAAAVLVVPFFAVATRLDPHLITDHLTSRYGSDRLSYPFDYWNAVACWGAMAVAVGLSLSANSSRTEIRAVGLACVPVAALSVYLSYSRFGAAAAAVAVVAAVALSKNRWTCVVNAVAAGAGSGAVILLARDHHEIARATGTAGAGSVAVALLAIAVACAVVAAITFMAGLDRARMDVRNARLSLAGAAIALLLGAIALHGPLGSAWEKFKNDKPPAANAGAGRFSSLGSSRYDVWTAAVDAFKDHPLGGVGPGSFEYYWSQHGDSPTFVRDAHSLYIETAAELGVPGLVALVTALGGLLAAAIQARTRWRRRRDLAAGSAVIASFVVFAVYAGVDWMWELGAVGTLALGGVAVAGAGGLERAREGGMASWTRALAVVFAFLAGAVQVPGLVSVERTRASQAALDAGDLDRARQLADQAITAESWAGSPYAGRALVSEKAGDLAGAERDVEHAIDNDPNNWRDHLLLARIDAERGDRRGVNGELREIRRLAPRTLYLNPLTPFRQQLDRLLAGSRSRARASAGP